MCASLQRMAHERDAAERAARWPRNGPGSLALEAMAPAHPVRVEVATPGGAVLVDERVATETVAAVRACLDNVLTHAGPDASAWVLAQSAPDEITISVRDDGPGIAAGRLEQAESEGRLGVASSIRGRVEDLGGTAVMESGSWGTEWELTVPTSTQDGQHR